MIRTKLNLTAVRQVEKLLPELKPNSEPLLKKTELQRSANWGGIFTTGKKGNVQKLGLISA
jgi:hypothetical protein